jgi:hypothetical protein
MSCAYSPQLTRENDSQDNRFMGNEDKLPESVIAAIQEESFLHSQLAVTEADYKEAVLRLVRVAQTDTSNASAAAQVLLSLYNGYEYHVDLTEMGVLDYANLQAALIAIRGRIFVSKEPHEVIENGKRIFEVLSDEWSHLHIKNRYQKHLNT